MKDSKEMLISILKTTHIGQIGIRSILGTSMRPTLRKALESQLREYDCIESEIHFIAGQRGWDLEDMDPALRFFTGQKTRMKLARGNCDSKIADMVIQGNTKGMIQSLKNLHQYPHQDDRISSICQKLVDCETANIRQMQTFL